MILFGLIIGVISTLFAMSVFHEFLKNTQVEKSSDRNETDNIVIPAFFVIVVGLLFGGTFGLWFVIGGVIGLGIWSGIDEEGREGFEGARKFITSAFTESARHEQRRQEKKKGSRQTNRRSNQTKREVSEVPPMTDFVRPILRWASRRAGVFHRREVMEAAADCLKLSFAARRERTREGNMLRHENRTSRSLSHLKKAGLVRSVSQGCYQITEAGKKEAFASNRRMTTIYLMRFPAYREWKEGEYTQEEFDSELLEMLQEAHSEGQQFCTIVSKHLHNRVVLESQVSRMAMACKAMWKLWEKQGSHEDRILHTTHGNQASTIEIKFDTD